MADITLGITIPEEYVQDVKDMLDAFYPNGPNYANRFKMFARVMLKKEVRRYKQTLLVKPARQALTEKQNEAEEITISDDIIQWGVKMIESQKTVVRKYYDWYLKSKKPEGGLAVPDILEAFVDAFGLSDASKKTTIETYLDEVRNPKLAAVKINVQEKIKVEKDADMIDVYTKQIERINIEEAEIEDAKTEWGI